MKLTRDPPDPYRTPASDTVLLSARLTKLEGQFHEEIERRRPTNWRFTIKVMFVTAVFGLVLTLFSAILWTAQKPPQRRVDLECLKIVPTYRAEELCKTEDTRRDVWPYAATGVILTVCCTLIGFVCRQAQIDRGQG